MRTSDQIISPPALIIRAMIAQTNPQSEEFSTEVFQVQYGGTNHAGSADSARASGFFRADATPAEFAFFF